MEKVMIEPAFIPDPTLIYMHKGDLCMEYRFLGHDRGLCVRSAQLRYAIYTMSYNDVEHVWETTFLKYIEGDDLSSYLWENVIDE